MITKDEFSEWLKEPLWAAKALHAIKSIKFLFPPYASFCSEAVSHLLSVPVNSNWKVQHSYSDLELLA
jgi:hypothetical protein